MTNHAGNERLRSYAELLLKVGVNLQEGQKLLIRTSTEAVELTRMVTELAYKLGSPYVEVMWSDDSVTRSRFLHGPEGSFSIISPQRAQMMIDLAKEGAASLAIVADDPDMLAGTDPKRMASFLESWRPKLKPYYDLAMNDAIAWCVAAAASPAWAQRVFPQLSTVAAVDKLWDAIFDATRITTADPVAAWREHADTLLQAKTKLNEKRYKALHFKGPGTDLRVGLAEGHVWDGGDSRSAAGHRFMANVPTEEVFTAPHRAHVDGLVRATKPLAYNGTIIDDFELRFEGGAVVEARAGKGQGALDEILATDEGSKRLGEVALVPASSPIAKTGVLFYETLFDENAACHIALGQAYGVTVEGSGGMTDEQKAAVGMNDSLTHVDFMIGSDQIDIDGELPDGSFEAVMRSGEWAG